MFSCDLEHLFSPGRAYQAVHIFAWDEDGHPSAVRIDVCTAAECLVALEAIKDSPASFVVFDGKLYSPKGEVQDYDPGRPASADELYLEFDVEYLGSDAQEKPRVSLFTWTQEEWEIAKRAVSHLLQQGLLSPLSCIEGSHTGTKQVIAAADLTHPHVSPESGSNIASLVREQAYRVQNGLEDDGA